MKKSNFRQAAILILIVVLCCAGNQKLFSQGMGISNVSITPDASSILELRSSTQGFLPPRLSASGGITSPAVGLLFYNTTTHQFNYFDGVWNTITSGTSPTLTGLTLSGLTGNSFLFSGTGGLLTSTAAPANGQLLIGSTGAAPALAALTGTANQITVTNAAGSITLSAPQNAESQKTPANPTGTAVTSGVMMGLAGAITPARSGTILIIISGDIANSTSGDGGTVQIRYGTGAAPANAAAQAGTAVGGLVTLTGVRANAWKYPFSLNAIVTGLTVGTAYWIDIYLTKITGGTASISGVSISVIEL